jgi:putative heme transporter
VVRRIGWREVLQSVVGIAVAVLLVAYALPGVTGTTWAAIGSQLQRVGTGPAVVMAVLLVLGLLSYTFTLIASLPGLTNVKALTVNAAGTMVSTLLPGGGAVGVALTYMMYRSWGFSRRNISTSIVVTSVWNILARLTLPVLAALVIIWWTADAPDTLVTVAVVAGAVGTLIIALFVAVLFSDAVAVRVGRAVGRVTAPLARRWSRLGGLERLLADQRARTGIVVRRGWVGMSLGLVGMFGFFFVLYVVAARTMGLDLALPQLFAAYAIRQFLTTVAITPGGLGVTEVGTAGVLVAFGGDPAAASATALLYAVYTHLLQVPIGLTAWGAWWFGPRKREASGQIAYSLVEDETEPHTSEGRLSDERDGP